MKSRGTAATIFVTAGVFSLSAVSGCDGSRSASGGAPSDSSPVAASSIATQKRIHKEWGRAMAKTPTRKGGCFKATHPSTTWEETPCGPPPSIPLVPAQAGPRASTFQVGNGGTADFASTVPGDISFAEGSFPAVSGVTSENGLAPGFSLSGYSLQLNTNYASHTALCNQGPNPSGCQAWQQFAYLPGTVFIQYWLINYFAAAPTGTQSCPPGFTFDDNGYYVGTTIAHEYDCFATGSGSAGAPYYTAADLADVALSGSAGNTDQVVLYHGGQAVAYTAPESSVLGLYQWWQSAEFNVFGPGEGSAAVFNYGSTMAVQTVTDSADSTGTACTAVSYTGETNNLSLVPNSCCPITGASPGIFFTQSNAPGATAFPCP